MTNEEDCVELGLACTDVCTALSRGLNGKMLKDLNNSVCDLLCTRLEACAHRLCWG